MLHFSRLQRLLYKKEIKGTARAFSESRHVLWVARRHCCNPFSAAGFFSKKLSTSNLSYMEIKKINGAIIYKANVDNIKDAVEEAVMRGADLCCANLGCANLGGADLRGAHLGSAHLGDADIGGADLCGANLGGAHLGGANLRGANLGGADLGSANL